MKKTTPKNIDSYIEGCPSPVQQILEKVRGTIQKAVPKAKEAISYQMPSFTLNGRYLIYFAAYKKHIGMYPAPREAEEFKAELEAYEGGKGTVQFPLDKPIPYGLIKKMVKFKAKEIEEKATSKKKK